MVIMWNCRYTAKSRNTQASQNVRNVGRNCTELHRSVIELARAGSLACLASWWLPGWPACLPVCLTQRVSSAGWIAPSPPAACCMGAVLAECEDLSYRQRPPAAPICASVCILLGGLCKSVSERITILHRNQKTHWSVRIGTYADDIFIFRHAGVSAQSV